MSNYTKRFANHGAPLKRERLLPGIIDDDAYNRSFEEEMAALGVEIIKRPKKGKGDKGMSVVEKRVESQEVPAQVEQVAQVEEPDTEAQQIRKQLEKKGLAGMLSVDVVMNVPKQKMKELIEKGCTNKQLVKVLAINQQQVTLLRKLYDMPGKRGGARRAKHEAKPKVDKVDDVSNASEDAKEALETLRYTLTDVTKDHSAKLDNLRDAHKIQGYDGNWNADPYMLGLYNGLELALAIFEDREPEYRELPGVESEPVPVESEEEKVVAEVGSPCPEPQLITMERIGPPPLLDITEEARVVAPLFSGIAKMLDRMGSEDVGCKVAVYVEIDRVDADDEDGEVGADE